MPTPIIPLSHELVQDARTVMQHLLCAVIVPVYNGRAVITRCLDALAMQTVGHERYQIIVVDDGSTDGTDAVINAWIVAHPPWDVTLVQQANAGPAAARNHGATIARAPLLLFTDADCAPTANWVAAMASVFNDVTVMGARGVYLTEQTTLVPRFVQAEYEDRYDRTPHLAPIDFIDTYSAAYRRRIFLESGGFDTIFTTASVEDQELSFRLAHAGHRMVFAANAQVVHFHDRMVRDYWWRKYYIGFWKALLVRRHPGRAVQQDSHTPKVLKIQMGLWVLLLAIFPLALGGLLWSPLKLFWWVVATLLILFLATTIPFMRKLARQSWMLALVSPFMLAVRSVALGAGYLVGTIRFRGTLSREQQSGMSIANG